jgi:hypothetical protein
MQDNVPCGTAFHSGEIRKAQQIGVWWAGSYGRRRRRAATHERGLRRVALPLFGSQPGESEPLAKTSRASWTIHGFESSCRWRDGGTNDTRGRNPHMQVSRNRSLGCRTAEYP